jgi:hypothetical protein
MGDGVNAGPVRFGHHADSYLAQLEKFHDRKIEAEFWGQRKPEGDKRIRNPTATRGLIGDRSAVARSVKSYIGRQDISHTIK